MDLARRGLLIHDVSSSSPPGGFPPPSIPSYHPPRVPDPSFLIIAVALIGILVTAFFLVSYLVFVFKCCLTWRQVDGISRFSVSQRNHWDNSLLVNSPPWVSSMRSRCGRDTIDPSSQFQEQGSWRRRKQQDRIWVVTVCLNEFQENEKLKIIPSCCHVFHVDCIGVWLQNNVNCLLCHTSISSTILFPVNTTLTSRPSQEEPIRSPDTMTRDEDFVVIELGGGNHGRPFSPESSFCSISITVTTARKGYEEDEVM